MQAFVRMKTVSELLFDSLSKIKTYHCRVILIVVPFVKSGVKVHPFCRHCTVPNETLMWRHHTVVRPLVAAVERYVVRA